MIAVEYKSNTSPEIKNILKKSLVLAGVYIYLQNDKFAIDIDYLEQDAFMLLLSLLKPYITPECLNSLSEEMLKRII